MKVYCIYKEGEDYSREASDWVREFTEATKLEVTVLDPESVEGEMFVRARDILQFPAVVAVDDSMGSVLQRWLGTPMPAFEQVAYYARTV